MKYIKINTLWKRDVNKHVIEGDFSKEEFNNIKLWSVSEKINGTNIRVHFENKLENPTIKIDGKTNEAQIPPKLYDYLIKTFTIEKLKMVISNDIQCVDLFGEGVGAGIKSSGNYFKDKGIGFILFDVYIDGWWLERKNVIDIANKLGVKYAPELGVMNLESVIDLVKIPRNSSVSEVPMIAEGIVARSYPLMLFRDGTPIMWKLKVVDYKK